MSDTLVIGGVTYTNVAGFKAKDDQDATQTYIKPSGSLPISANNTYDVTQYASAVVNVSGGSDTLKERLHRNATNPVDTSKNYGDFYDAALTKVPAFSFYRCAAGFGRFDVPNATEIGQNSFYLDGSGSPTVVFAPKAAVGTGAFQGCDALEIAVVKGAAATNSSDLFRKYSLAMALTKVDFTASSQRGITANSFNGCGSFSTLILRDATISALGNINAFANTPFDSGGTGGTIYIPKSLYDHLGDNSSSDYRHASNWATIDGYGTIAWAQIEGSYYETHYADGTAIPTA